MATDKPNRSRTGCAAEGDVFERATMASVVGRDMNSDCKLFRGDCLDVLKSIESGSVDMVLADLPYGTTACKWDTRIPFEPLWKELHRACKTHAAMVMFGKEIFSAELMLSNKENFRYSLVWKKSKVSRFAQAKLRFLDTHEDVLVFSRGKCSQNSKLKMNFNPQGLRPYGKIVKDMSHKTGHRENRKQLPDYFQEHTGYPKSILEFQSVMKTDHPTQNLWPSSNTSSRPTPTKAILCLTQRWVAVQLASRARI